MCERCTYFDVEHPTIFALSTISGSIENDKKLSHFCHGVWLLVVEIVSRCVVSPTLNANPTLFVIPCKMCGESYIYNVANMRR